MKALAPLGTCPVIDKAIVNLPYAPTTLANWYTAVMNSYPKGHRYIADNMFTSASAEELLPGIRKIIETMPPHPSHFIFTGWKTSPERADMVYGVEDEIYMALYTIWKDPADDERYRDWAASRHGGDVAFGDRHLARRRESVPASGAIHRRIEHGTPRQGALGLRPGWSIPQLDGRRLTAGGRPDVDAFGCPWQGLTTSLVPCLSANRGRCAACEPNRRFYRLTSKGCSPSPQHKSSTRAVPHGPAKKSVPWTAHLSRPVPPGSTSPKAPCLAGHATHYARNGITR